ncbi:hypothetical protein ADEAN_000819900 [Angomonas deanei]|uniref:Uncharacterized protein n=1 Tax=Angomonas deanei TaxID=59799 RepID=A0A7G2CNK6_9TRYP|nr:hypothetical protein ADEAN_000819900 [Angomonas deanei]
MAYHLRCLLFAAVLLCCLLVSVSSDDASVYADITNTDTASAEPLKNVIHHEEENEKEDDDAAGDFNGPSTIRWRAKVRSDGCRYTIRQYLRDLHSTKREKLQEQHTTAAQAYKAALMTDTPKDELTGLFVTLKSAERALRQHDAALLKEYGGDIPKTCVAVIEAQHAARMEAYGAVMRQRYEAYEAAHRDDPVSENMESDVPSFEEFFARLRQIAEVQWMTFASHFDLFVLTLEGVTDYVKEQYIQIEREVRGMTFVNAILPEDAHPLVQKILPILPTVLRCFFVIGATIAIPFAVIGAFLYYYVYLLWGRLFILYYSFGFTSVGDCVHSIRQWCAVLVVQGRATDCLMQVLHVLSDSMDADDSFFNILLAIFLFGSALVTLFLVLLVALRIVRSVFRKFWNSNFGRRRVKNGKGLPPSPTHPAAAPPATTTAVKAAPQANQAKKNAPNTNNNNNNNNKNNNANKNSDNKNANNNAKQNNNNNNSNNNNNNKNKNNNNNNNNNNANKGGKANNKKKQ